MLMYQNASANGERLILISPANKKFEYCVIHVIVTVIMNNESECVYPNLQCFWLLFLSPDTTWNGI